MRLAVSRKVTVVGRKKKVNRKKKVLVAKVKVSGFLVKTFTCFGTEKCYICSKSFAFSLCQKSYLN